MVKLNVPFIFKLLRKMLKINVASSYCLCNLRDSHSLRCLKYYFKSFLAPTTLSFTLLASTAFLAFQSLTQYYVQEHGPIAPARTLITLNSRLYALFSLALAIAIACSGSEGAAKCAYIYHVSKFYEYIDVLLLQAQGISIGEHMTFHHLTVLTSRGEMERNEH